LIQNLISGEFKIRNLNGVLVATDGIVDAVGGITSGIELINETKQETLEEASWRFNPLKKLDGEFLRAAFIKGAQWQAKRMHSEEDIIDLIQFLSMNQDFNSYSSVSKETAKRFFEQFKNR
jgi:hypothetical protein